MNFQGCGRLFLMAVFLICVAQPFSAQAHTLNDDPGTYNPNNLISNDNFLGYGYDGSAVNNFLGSRGSWLSGYRIPEYQDVPYKYRDGNGNCAWASTSVRQFNDITGEGLYGGLAGDLIAKKGHDHGVNPQVTLVTLEKESSAISRGTVQSTPVEMWVLGYGWNDTMAGCGYDQGTAQSRAVTFGGVGQQIAYATNGFRSLYSQSSDWQSPFNTVDGVTIHAENQATRALYRYTPYVHNGNHNFWHFFTQWFKDTATAYHPPVVKDGDRVYLADQGQLWHIQTADAFDAWNFRWSEVGALEGSPYAGYPKVGGVSRLIRTSWGRVFYIENGRKRPIMSPRIFNLWHFNWDDVSPLNDEIIKQIPTGIPMWELTRVNGTSTVYFQSRGENHPVPNPQIFKDGWNFDWAEVADVPSYVVDQFPVSQAVSRLAKSNSGVIFFMDHGVKFAIPSPNTFNQFGFRWSDVIGIESSFLDNFPTRGTLRGLIGAPDGRVFYLDNGAKRYVSGDVFRKRGFNLGDVAWLDWAGLNLFPNGSAL